MNGIIIQNTFNDSSSFTSLISSLKLAFKKFNISISIKSNSDFLCKLYDNSDHDFLNNIDFVLFWDKDTDLCAMIEDRGVRTFNSSKAISICDNKFLTYLELFKNEINIPKSILIPKSFFTVDYSDKPFIKNIVNDLGLPLIIKETFGSFGLQVHLAHTVHDVCEILKSISPNPVLAQQFIKSSFGKDLRLYVVGGEVVASMLRKNDSGDFRANIANGGNAFSYSPTKEEMNLAIHVCNVLDLDFAGVDILIGENGMPIVCEVNSNAHFAAINELNNTNVEYFIVKHIINSL